MTAPEVFSFEVTPTEGVDSFDAMVMDVPTMLGLEAAARRAWWSAFHLLGPRGIEPEDFVVRRFEDDTPGALVTSGGLVKS